MTFCNWDKEIHNDEEQLKRIKRAESADMTPTSIDYENQTGVFKGSGKKPYEVSLDFCTCSDFRRRKLPCKHIYRLAMELGLFDSDYDVGINKFDLSKAIFSLDVEVQKALYDICCDAAYHSQITFVFNKEEFPKYIELITNGFCIEILSNYHDAFLTVPVSTIKEMFKDIVADDKPKYNAITKTYLNWISENDYIIANQLSKHYAVLQLNEQINSKVHAIVSRYRKKFIKKEVPYVDDFFGDLYSVEYEEVFNNEII